MKELMEFVKGMSLPEKLGLMSSQAVLGRLGLRAGHDHAVLGLFLAGVVDAPMAAASSPEPSRWLAEYSAESS